jgi:hypothetical protein
MNLNAEKYGLVLCEGKEDLAVLKQIAQSSNLRGLKIEEYGGKSKLSDYLRLISKNSDFISGRIHRILVTRDADEAPEAAYQSACDGIDAHFGIKFSTQNVWLAVTQQCEIALWIAPGKGRTGMIESLCLDAAKSTTPSTFDCLDEYTGCLKNRHKIELHEKERFGIWTIAAQGTALGQRRLSFSDALQRIDFDWSDPVFSEIRELLTACSQANH